MQNYKNHRRFHPPFHFVLMPLLLLHLIFTVVRFFQEPNIDRAEYALLALVLLGITALARINSLKVQDRVVRLEEQIRYHRLLSRDLAFQAENLPLNQIIALRFASDSELSGKIAQILGGKLNQPAEIKQSIQNWRADDLRV